VTDDDDECLKALQHFITVHLNIKSALLRCCSGIAQLFVTLNVIQALEFTIWA
jgi:hypothetical protein